MTTLTDLSRDLEELVARTAPSVVAVEHHDGQGSGVIVAGDGYVITNSHVARSSSDDRRVRLASGEELAARLVGDDPASDLAVLSVDARGLPSLPLADERRLRMGQLVVAIGNPLRFERSVSLGIVSAIERSLPGSRSAPGLLEGLVQTDAAINPGNSGGPLLDATGAVVGINTAIIPYARGIGFAIPAHTASWIASVLIRDGEVRRPFLGISARGEDLDPTYARAAGHGRAVRVMEVVSGSPAETAGLRAGDVILAAGNEQDISYEHLIAAIRGSEGKPLSLHVKRGDVLQTIVVTPRKIRDAVVMGAHLSPFETRTVEPGPWQAVKLSVAKNWEWTTQIAETMVGLFTRETSVKQLMGPVAIADLSGSAAEAGWIQLFSLMAMISLNLGLINLMPIPVLDGGHIFILAVEGLARRDFSMKVKEKMLLAGFVLLLALMVTVIYNDLMRIQWIEKLVPWR